MPECGADGNEQTAPARLSVRSVSKWRQIDEIAPAAAGARPRNRAESRAAIAEIAASFRNLCRWMLEKIPCSRRYEWDHRLV